MRPDPGPPVNERILRFRDIRVIGSDGAQLGIMQSRQALNIAKEEGLDLVMVSPTAQPPVCKIIDYGRFKYETEKQNRDGKKKQQELKGIKISPRIAEHDLGHLVRNAIKFLEEGHKVKVTCMFKSREITHPELGRKKLETFAEQVAEVGTIERLPVLEGKMMIMIINPKPQANKPKQHAKTQDKQDSGEAIQDLRDGQDHASEVAQQPPVPAQEGVS